MKKTICIFLCLFFFACAKKQEIAEPELVCENFTLTKRANWKYIFIETCSCAADSLELKLLETVADVEGVISLSSPNSTNYCISANSLHALIEPVNLPDCFKKDGLRVRFSGDRREIPKGRDTDCGYPFELTKIELVK